MDGSRPPQDLSLVGIGLYTAADARRFAGADPSAVRRWLNGYRARGRRYPPLWRPQVDLGDGGLHLGFRDLTEIRVVAALAGHGIPVRTIHRAIEIARREFGLERPLSTKAFRTDGKRIYLLLSAEDGPVVDLVASQYAFRRIIEPSFRHFDFDRAGEPIRWHVAPGIVLDPQRAFGQPIDAESGIPAEILADAVAAEGSVGAAARAYGVRERSVRRSLAFTRAGAVARAA